MKKQKPLLNPPHWGGLALPSPSLMGRVGVGLLRGASFTATPYKELHQRASFSAIHERVLHPIRSFSAIHERVLHPIRSFSVIHEHVWHQKMIFNSKTQ